MSSAVGATDVARRFEGYQTLTVRQRKNWLEILTSFETRNRYEVFDRGGAALVVQEKDEGFLALMKRVILGPMRPFHAAVEDSGTGELLMVIKRPWRWIFHTIEVFSGSGEKLGTIEKRWSWIRRIYTIKDDTGRAIAEIFGPFFKPWTFEINADGRKVGQIQKKWSGLGKEMFTDADNFGVDLHDIGDPKLKALAFAATVLVDIVHFERSKSS